MKEQIISLETAKKAKEKGFDWRTNKVYVEYLTDEVLYDYRQGENFIGTEKGTVMIKDSHHSQIFAKYDSIPVPTQSLLQKWLRDVHKIHLEIHYERGDWAYILHQLPSNEDVKFAGSGECQDGDLWLDSDVINGHDWYQQEYKSYEEALEAGLLAALDLLD